MGKKIWLWLVQAAKDIFAFVIKYVDKAISVFEEPGVTPPKFSAKRVFLAFLVLSYMANLRNVSNLKGFAVVSAVHFIPAMWIIWAIRNKKA